MPKYYTEKEATKKIQKYLREIAKEDKNMVVCPIDGVFDDDTKSAVKQFQYKCGISETGKVDKVTNDAIYENYLEIKRQKSKPNGFYIFPIEETNFEAKKGDKSFLIASVQHILNELSYFYDGYENVKISGVFDEATEKCILDFQAKNRLNENGKIDKSTWNNLAIQFENLSYINRR